MATKAVRVIDDAKAQNINLKVLCRIDPETEELVGAGGHVCLYDFIKGAPGSESYERKNVEGSLFVVKRRSSPQYRIVVLNKLTQDNYFEDLDHTFSHESQQERFIMYYNKKAVTGVFVYDLDGYPKLMELFERVKTMVGAEASSTQTTGSNGSQALQEDDFFDKKLDPSKQGPDVVAQRFKLVHASAAQLAPASSAPPVPALPARQPAPVAPAAPSAGGGLAAFFPALVGKGAVGGMPPLPLASAAPPHHMPSAVLANGSTSPASASEASSQSRPPALPVAASPRPPPEPSPTPFPASPVRLQTGLLHTQAPPFARPALMRPSDFAAQKLAESKNASPAPITPLPEVTRDAPPEVAPKTLPAVFAKLMRPVPENGAGRHAGPKEPTLPAASDGTRDRVRAALASLLESDAFIDTIAEHLKKSGLLQ